MAAWVWISCAAALAQTIRFMLQKQMAGAGLGPAGATYARFLYSAPLVVLGMAVLVALRGDALPRTGAPFWGFAAFGGTAQILATVLTVTLLTRRNFVVGVTLMKTEVLQAALVGLILLGERLTLPVLAAIATGMAGVMSMSDGRGAQPDGWRGSAAVLGLAAGALFGISAVCYRGAALSLDTGDALLRAGLTLAVVTTGQTLAMSAWFAWRDRARIGRVLAAWRQAVWIGLFSMLGSLGWFTAFALQQAALVKAVAQVEILFSILASTLFFGERITRREWIGMALILGSILALIVVL